MKHVGVFVEFEFVWNLFLVVFGVVLGNLVTILQVDLVTKTFLADIAV